MGDGPDAREPDERGSDGRGAGPRNGRGAPDRRAVRLMGLRESALGLLSSVELEVRYRRRRRRPGLPPAGPPVFVVGCGHSGTTLLLRVLGAHSHLHAIHYESGLAFQPEAARRRSLALFEKLRVVAGKPRWVEKTPRHVRAIAELSALCPGAGFVGIVRDGRDVACSLHRRTGTFRDATLRWVDDNRRLLAHRDDPHVHVLRYEDLVIDFEGCVTAALKALGEAWEPAVADYHRTPMPFQAPHLKSPWVAARFGDDPAKRSADGRIAQIHSPLFDGRGRWQDEMTPEQRAVFKEHAQDLLESLGYADDDRW